MLDVRAKNWIQIVRRGPFPIVRAHGPLQPNVDKTRKLNDTVQQSA